MPVVYRLIELYRLWHSWLPHVVKSARYTLGSKVDETLLEIAELALVASVASKPLKVAPLQRAGTKIDLVKLFLRMAWEIQAIDTSKYSKLSGSLDEIGRMIGGWLKQVQETPRR